MTKKCLVSLLPASPPAQAQAQPLSPTGACAPRQVSAWKVSVPSRFLPPARPGGQSPQRQDGRALAGTGTRSLQPLPGLSPCLADLPSPAHHHLGEASPRLPAQRRPLLHTTSMTGRGGAGAGQTVTGVGGGCCHLPSPRPQPGHSASARLLPFLSSSCPLPFSPLPPFLPFHLPTLPPPPHFLLPLLGPFLVSPLPPLLPAERTWCLPRLGGLNQLPA